MEGISSGLLLDILQLVIYFCIICSSVKKYFQSKDIYWKYFSISFLLLIFAQGLAVVLKGTRIVQIADVFYISTYYMLFMGLKKGLNKFNEKSSVKASEILLNIFDLIIVSIVSFSIYCFLFPDIAENILSIQCTLNLYINLIYPILDFMLLYYFIFTKKSLGIKEKKNSYFYLYLLFLFWTITDFINVYEIAYSRYLHDIYKIITILAYIAVTFVFYFVKSKELPSNYGSLRAISDKNEIVVSFNSNILITLALYFIIYIWSFRIGIMSDKYRYILNCMGVLLLFCQCLRQVVIIYINNRTILKLENIAIRDPLTKIYNRGYAFKLLKDLFNSSKKNNLQLSVLMIDIDHFKKINDKYGHAFGDCVIKQVADILSSSVLDTYIVSRYGGEEFLIILPNCAEREGKQISEEIRQKIEGCAFRQNREEQIYITASVGGSFADHTISGELELIDKADQALYEAKKERNKCIWNG